MAKRNLPVIPFVVSSPLDVKPCEQVMITGRPQIPIHPFRLRIEPEIAPFFTIDDVQIGRRSAWPWAQSVPASQFMQELGDEIDPGEIHIGIDMFMIVTNRSHLHPRAPVGGFPLPFVATWSAYQLPRRLWWRDDTGRWRDDTSERREETGRSELDRVQETIGRPEPIVRGPSVGWDPYGDD